MLAAANPPPNCRGLEGCAALGGGGWTGSTRHKPTKPLGWGGWLYSGIRRCYKADLVPFCELAFKHVCVMCYVSIKMQKWLVEGFKNVFGNNTAMGF